MARAKRGEAQGKKSGRQTAASSVAITSGPRCTCRRPPNQPGLDHETKCKVRENIGWRQRTCEWVPHLGTFVSYMNIQDDSKKGFHVGLLHGGKEIPLFDCYCNPPRSYTCAECGVSRYTTNEPFTKLKQTGTGTQTFLGGGGGGSMKDRHYGEHLAFPDGTVIWASSSHTRKKGDPIPDFGLYLDSMWRPECLAYLINWRDYGLPQIDWKVVIWAIEQAFDAAKKGLNVEVGCIGGHGRTGTVLACMATIAGVPAKDAVKWVKTNYCDHAVESADQAWWVEWFAATRAGEEPPAKPKPAAKPTTTWSKKPCIVPGCTETTSSHDGICNDCYSKGVRAKDVPKPTTTPADKVQAASNRPLCLRKCGRTSTGEDGLCTECWQTGNDVKDAAAAKVSQLRKCVWPGCTTKYQHSTNTLCSRHRRQAKEEGGVPDAAKQNFAETFVPAPCDEQRSCIVCGNDLDMWGGESGATYAWCDNTNCDAGIAFYDTERGFVYTNKANEEITDDRELSKEQTDSDDLSESLSSEVDEILNALAEEGHPEWLEAAEATLKKMGGHKPCSFCKTPQPIAYRETDGTMICTLICADPECRMYMDPDSLRINNCVIMPPGYEPRPVATSALPLGDGWE